MFFTLKLSIKIEFFIISMMDLTVDTRRRMKETFENKDDEIEYT